jgi:hypothetical protein
MMVQAVLLQFVLMVQAILLQFVMMVQTVLLQFVMMVQTRPSTVEFEPTVVIEISQIQRQLF